MLVGAPGGIACAEPGPRGGHHDDRGGFGGSGANRGSQASGNTKRNLSEATAPRVGDGRNGGVLTGRFGMPARLAGRGVFGGPAGTEAGLGSPQTTEGSGVLSVGGETGGQKPRGIGAAYKDGNAFRPGIHVAFPRPTNGGWARWGGLYSGLADALRLPSTPGTPGVPQPQPATQAPTTLSPSVAGEEPVVDSGPTGGHGRGSEYPHPAAAEVPVIEAPLVAPVIPAAPVVPPAPPLPAPRIGVNPGIPPRVPPEPPPGNPLPPLGQSVGPGPQPLPPASPLATQAAFRVGYSSYLRTAGTGELAAMALPGVAGMLLLTAAGGLVGYRQAKAGHSVRARSIERFLD
ncbi:hypothetical protein [Mycobacterium sp.]|jgi:hypothetical protein|uniref:hypothetical protein n=1 Tax=Mycobacterium sp. TaxID=1785 RepID=UPI002D28AAFF|nr:hypothetical protein [Mycobacterium sp.]HZA10114.1 hypothetical protein [Mycobacterium sp.]